MKKLNNTKEDREYLYTLLSSGYFPMATITIYGFTSQLASSLKPVDYVGKITEIDLKSGYCDWLNVYGEKMCCVNISSITLHSN